MAIGAPGQTVSGAVGAGAGVLISDAPADQAGGFAPLEINQDSPKIPGTPEAGDHFGAAVSLSLLPALARYQLIMGVPGEDIGAVVDAGQWLRSVCRSARPSGG